MGKSDTGNFMQAVLAEAAHVDRIMREDLDKIKPEVDALLWEVLDYGLFSGGKRVRPLLVILSARLCGCSDDSVYHLSRAFEYLHAATLFHDDVIDNADTRRGKPTVNIRFGLTPAILAGDYLHARSMNIVGDMVGRDGLSIFCEATAGMVDGEFMQLRNAEQFNLSEPGYYDAIMGKTGLLIAAACETGALFGGGNKQQCRNLRQYGVGLGCAFQMIDDLLDYTGDAEKTGKAVGNDLIEGKMTLPLIVALTAADETDRKQLAKILKSSEARRNEFSAVYGLVEKYNGFGETRRRAEKHVAEAVSCLDIFEEPSALALKNILIGLAHYVLIREK